jgi:hypothetical protein
MDFPGFTYQDLEATFRHKVKKRMPKLWSYKEKLYDPYKPKYYTTFEMFVPQPTLDSPLPCVLISIRNSKYKTFFRVADPADLAKVFTLPPEELQKCHEALCSAKLEASGIERILKDLINQRMPPKDVPGMYRQQLEEMGIVLDPETGELTEKGDSPLIE